MKNNIFYNRLISVPYTGKNVKEFIKENNNLPLDVLEETGLILIKNGMRENISKLIVYGFINKIKWNKNILYKFYYLADSIEEICFLFEAYDFEAIDLLTELIIKRENVLLERLVLAFQLLAYYSVKYKDKITDHTQLLRLIKDNIKTFERNYPESYLLFLNCIYYLKSRNIIKEGDLKFENWTDSFEKHHLFIVDSYLSKDIFELLPEHAIVSSEYGPLVRSLPKVGRNDPCPCGSGKKYKKCCLNKKNIANTLLKSGYEKTIHKETDYSLLNISDFLDLNAYELENIDINRLNKDQLKSCLKRTLDFNNFELAYNVLIQLRKHYVETDGVLPGNDIKIKGKIVDFDDLFDDYLYDVVLEIIEQNRYDLIEKFIKLSFEGSSGSLYNEYQYYINIHKNNKSDILDYIENEAFKGIENPGNSVELFYKLIDHFPGLAFHFFRAVIAASPDRDFDIYTMMDDIAGLIFKHSLGFDMEPSIKNFFKLTEEDLSEENKENYQEIKKLNEENKKAHIEIKKQNQIINKLIGELDEFKKNKREKEPLKSRSQEIRKEIDHERINELQLQIANSQEKIARFKNIINEKQESIKKLKNRIKSERKDKITDREKDIEDYQKNDYFKDLNYEELISKKILIPEFSDKFMDSSQKVSEEIVKKAILSMTKFTINDSSVLKHVKALKAKKNHYSIRISIHHRLLFEYIPNVKAKAVYLIHRKDLEKYIARL